MEIYSLKPIKFLTWHILWPIYTGRLEGFAGPKENIALNMFEALKNKLKLSEDGYLALSDHIHQIEIPAKTVLLNEGEVAKKIFLIEKGCLRVWFNHDGRDITVQFFFENESVASMESFRSGMPSMTTIESIEPCKLWYIHKSDLDRLLPELEQIPELRGAFIDSLFDRMFHYMRHFTSFIKDSPQQRYRDLLKERPMIIQRVSQHYIASYLGISAVHLSRIKSQLAREK
jgi:CRP-like cAMP-binding protein